MSASDPRQFKKRRRGEEAVNEMLLSQDIHHYHHHEYLIECPELHPRNVSLRTEQSRLTPAKSGTFLFGKGH